MESYQELLESVQRYCFVQQERHIATWIRDYAQPDSQERYLAENTALRVLLDLTTMPATELFAADGEQDSVVNALARALGNSHQKELGYSTSFFASLAALTCAAAGNFASAKVFASKARQCADLGPAERWMMEVLSERKIDLTRSEAPWGFASYAQLTNRALSSGDPKDFEGAREAFLKACDEAGQSLIGSDKELMLLWEHVHTRMEDLSAARVMRALPFPHQAQAYFAQLLESSSLFYPSQVHTLLNYPLIQRGEPVFITLPTSTGKSLLGELALVASLTWDHSRWLAVYIAPYRALTAQILRDMRRRLRGAGIFCDMRHGGYLSREPLIQGRQTVIITTPESFDGMLRKNPDLYSTPTACVFDEFHLIEQEKRGLYYEGLIGRLLKGAAGTGWPKIVALSAVVDGTQPVETWLQTQHIVSLPWKPTGRRIAIVDSRQRIKYYTPEEKLPGDTDAEMAWHGNLFDKVRYVTPAEIAVDQFYRFKEEPVLVVAKSRERTRTLATELRQRLPILPTDHSSYQKATQILERFPYLYTLCDGMKYGVAYHNASLPSWVRSEIEQLLSDKQLRFVVSTTTLAEGVDFPFRVIVLADRELWQFGKEQPMSRLLVRNIAGRGGRAWAYSEGDTILLDTSAQTSAGAFEMYIQPATYCLQSSVRRLLQSDLEIQKDSTVVLESQFMAFLKACENQSIDNTEEEFTTSLYAGLESTSAAHVRKIAEDLVGDMLIGERPVMAQHSPLKLTEFGEILLTTGLSPHSGIALAQFISEFVPGIELRKNRTKRERYHIEWVPLLAGFWNRLSNTPDLDIRELRDSQYRKIGKRGFPVRSENSALVAMAWVSGVPIELIGYLVFRGQKETKERIDDWLNMRADVPPGKFEEQIDKIAGFCGYLSSQWSWVFRGGATIGRYLQDDVADRFDDLALRLEFGVSNLSVADWLREGCPVDRAKLDAVYNKYIQWESDLLERSGLGFSEWLEEKKGRLIGLQVGPFPRIRVLEQEIENLQEHLRTTRRSTT